MGISHLVFRLLFALAGGTIASLGAVRQSRLGRTYFLYHGLGAVALAAFAYLVAGRTGLPPEARPWLWAFLALALGASLALGKRPLAGTALLALAVLAFVATVVLDVTHGLAADKGLFVANALLSALLLGFAIMAMLLGHWYLVQPKLSIDELGRVSKLFIALVIVRFALGTYVLWGLLAPRSEAEIYRYLLGGNPGIFLLMRWAWGLAAPLALCYLIWGTVKIRSTQSATGILYVADLAVLTGEILSQYLTLFHGIAI